MEDTDIRKLGYWNRWNQINIMDIFNHRHFGAVLLLNYFCDCNIFSCFTSHYLQLSLRKNQSKASPRCKAPAVSPQRVEKVINQCQDEVKLAIIQEALDSLQNVKEEEKLQHGIQRFKRQTFSDDEKKIAGCLLQCVYRQVKAVDQLGFPEAQGLIKLYTEGGDDEEYSNATSRAVHACLAISSRVIAEKYQEPGLACNVAYDVFECVTNEVAKYCGKI